MLVTKLKNLSNTLANNMDKIPMNSFMNHERWLMSAARFGLALLLLASLATTAQAAIAIQDGNPLTYTYTASGAINKSFTVTPGASVLVVLVEDRSVNNAEPATINWLGGQTLTRDVQSSGIPSTTRGLAMYHLYNPTPGTTNIVATVTGASGNWVTAYTLSGVDTTIAPIVAGATSGSTSTTTTALNINVQGVPAGAWAAVNACWGNTPSTSAYINVTNQAGLTINSTTVVDGADNATTAAAGYVSSLTAGTNIFTAGYTTGGKFVFAVEVFSPPTAPSISVQPQSVIAFTNGTPKFRVTAVGSAPLHYQWYTNSITTALSNGGNLTGTTNTTLTIANATLANGGNYFVVVTNLLGSATSSVASLTFTSPSGAYETCVMTNAAVPFAYYSFSETGDPSVGGVVAQDSIGSFNGTYGVASQNGFNGIVGPQTSLDGLIGFPDGNTALSTVNGANSYVTLPAFNLNNGVGTNVLTITAWIHPNGQMPNAAGIVFCRNGTSTISGLDYLADTSNTLNYNWANDANTYTWNSGLVPPIGVWSLVALVVTSTNATIYLCNTNNGMLSSTHVYPHVVQKFDGPTLVGLESFNASRVFNGSIDEVALFNQALTPSQMGALFSAASGIANFPPTVAANPTWAPATVYVGQTASITVNAGGTAPLSYQWMAGAVGSGIYTNLANGGNISGATNATLTITNAQLGNYLDYVVQINNTYGAVTSTVPATLTVLEAGPPTTFTLNYTGLPIQQGVGADWNSVNMWSPLGVPASTAVFANPGSTFEVVVGSRLRNPQATTYNVFPGDVLQVDGDGIFENNAVVGVGEIRFKDTNPAVPSTNYFKNLVLNGGQLNIGDSMDVILQGSVTVTANSTLYALGSGGTNQTFRIDSYLTGSGTMQLYLSNSTPSAALVITGNTNTFTGQWNIVQGPLVGLGANSLGTNTITIGRTNGILETFYPINNPDGSLVLNGQMFLTQNDTFKSVYINGVGLTAGTYSAATLSASYPSNFPATFIALYGTAATAASGQITVLAGGSPTIGANPTWTPPSVYVGQTSSITVSAAGTPPLSYQWMAGEVGSGVYTNLPTGGNNSGTTNATLTITNAQLANYLDYVVRISNAYGAVTSTVPATLTVMPPGPATTFTLDYAGPIQEGIGADWNTVNVWNPGGLPASTAMIANPGSSFEVVVGSRLRNPAATTYNVFPGTQLIIDGDGVFENNTVSAVGEFRFKNSAFSATTNYFNNLVLNGGQLNIGDSTDVILQGAVTVSNNSVLYALGTGTNQTFRVDSYLTGSGSIQLYLSNSTPSAALVITGNTNTFNGQWDIEQGPLVGTGANSLGTNSITIGAGGMLETSYPIHNTNSSLILNGQMFLTQNDTFESVVINGTPLAPGFYTAATLSGLYTNFPATFIALYGTTATSASGSINVGNVVAPPSSPHITGIQVSGTGLSLSATNGTPGGPWALLQSTNLALPLNQWQINITGTFDGSGNLSTNIPNTATNKQDFYILKVQ